jgi:hypothetical protein
MKYSILASEFSMICYSKEADFRQLILIRGKIKIADFLISGIKKPASYAALLKKQCIMPECYATSVSGNFRFYFGSFC